MSTTGPAVRPFFAPWSVAVIGVSASPTNLGRHIVGNLVEFGFRGEIIPVGPGGGEVAGRMIVPSLAAAPGAVDLAVVLVPVSRILPALEDCGRAGVRAVVISSGGFAEYEAGRASLEREVLQVARRYGFRVMGPNCIGVVNLACGLCTPFAPLARRDFVDGPHSVISQSGGVMLYLADVFSEERLGVRALISEGNKLDVDEAALLPHLVDDPGTRVIFLYLEGILRGRELLAAAAGSPKPVVALKANVADSSARIAHSHTAALANDERVVEAAFRQAGILQVRDLEQFVVCAKAFRLPPLCGDRLAVACMSGGMGVVAADACARHGFELPSLPERLLRDLERRGRGGVIHLGNPLDLGDIHDPAELLLALEQVLALPDIDGAAFCLPSPAGAGRVMSGGPSLEAIIRRIEELSQALQKPVALSFFAGRRAVEPLLRDVEIPVFWSLAESIEALALQRAFWRHRERRRPAAFVDPGDGGARRATRPDVGGLGPTPLLPAVFQFLAHEGIPVEEVGVARTPGEAVALAEALGYPVALKLVSPQISHKTEVGGVALDLRTAEDVEVAFQGILDRVRTKAPEAQVAGVAVQRMHAGGHEVIVGARRDPAFGPVVLFGLGGIWVEALGDVAVRVAPIDRDDALEMIGEIRGAGLLQGLRGRPPADLDALAGVIAAVSRLIAEVPEIHELDLNPVMVCSGGARVLDARIAVERQGGARA